MIEEPAISIRNVSLGYVSRKSEVRALEDIQLDIYRGQFVSILGPSGCGKSTLLNVVGGMLLPTTGQVRVLGNEVRGPVIDLGIVFQSDLLMPWRTVLKNVLLQAEVRKMPKGQAEARAHELLDMVGLRGFHDRYPRELSGGMRQRCAIARGLLHDPPLLLMDEPFGALDAMTRDQMNIDLLAIQHASSKTILFVTHSIDEAILLSNRVIVMSPRPGRILDDIPIDLPGERDAAARDTPEFRKYSRHIRSLFEDMGLLRASVRQ